MEYIITDPCYILDSNAWDDCCNIARSNNNWDEVLNEAIEKELEKLSGKKAYACGTGYGDWVNSIHCSNYDKVINTSFCADAGMVCVCALTDKVKKALKRTFPVGQNGSVAIINCEGDIKVEFDTRNYNWTVVRIEDDKDSFHTEKVNLEDDEE